MLLRSLGLTRTLDARRPALPLPVASKGTVGGATAVIAPLEAVLVDICVCGGLGLDL